MPKYDRQSFVNGLLVCSDCKVPQELENFTKDKRMLSGRKGRCLECSRKRNSTPEVNAHINELRKLSYMTNPLRREIVKQRSRATYARDPSIARRTSFLRLGVNQDWYDSKMVDQGGLCAICRMSESTIVFGRVKTLAIDHDHACCPTKKVMRQMCPRAFML